jgi:hypothetical protein
MLCGGEGLLRARTRALSVITGQRSAVSGQRSAVRKEGHEKLKYVC